MSVLLLTSNGDWTYRLGVTPIKVMPGAHSLEVSSQWLGAKDRRAKVRQLQITLVRPDLQYLHDYLGAYLRMTP